METTGKKLSFYQLFAEENFDVEIPIIQRDYAQGRSDKSEVRTNFLNALYDYLAEGIPGRELDFVYGAIGTEEDKKRFIPLDGQQRLTTLFLLHWYLSLVSGQMPRLRALLAIEGKSRFKYETRTSTTEFCNHLVKEDIVYHGFDKDNRIAALIRNEGWFYKGWEFDPSVSAMLEMLDAIEEKFCGRPNFLELLMDAEDPIIVFQFLNLGAYGLTDDLYVKMNSRGKPLTPFENFKAKLGQKIASFSASSSLPDTALPQGTNPGEYFSSKIDKEWLNLFWDQGGRSPKKVDEQLMNFIRVILANHTAIAQRNSDISDSIRILFKSRDAVYGEHQREFLSYYSYDKLGALTPHSLAALISMFDKVSMSLGIEDAHRPDSFHYVAIDMLRRVMGTPLRESDKVSLLSGSERMLFHAYMGYLVRYPHTHAGLRNWMRVAYNLAENTRADDATAIANGLKELDKLLGRADDILNALGDSELKISFFYSRQVEEERIKASLLLRSVRWTELIWRVEQHNILKGQVGCILEFCGILAYYIEHGDMGWTEAEDEVYFQSFSTYADKVIAALNYIPRSKNEGYHWERAMLTKGDYLIANSYYRYHLLTDSLTDRDNSWKRLLRLNAEADPDMDKKRLLVKALLDDVRFDVKNVAASCALIAQDETGGWRALLIQEPRLFTYSYKGFIRRESDSDIRLLETTKLTYHSELRTMDLYLRAYEGKNLEPLHGLQYQVEYGNDGVSHICLGAVVKGEDTYKATISYVDDEFVLSICRDTSAAEPAPRAAEMVALFERLGYHDAGDGPFVLSAKTREETVAATDALIAALKL